MARLRILVLVAALGGAACSPTSAPPSTPPQTPPQTPPVYRLTATLQDLMDGVVDPAADALWDSVAYIATTAGIEDRRPHTDEQWKAVRIAALTLIESANLLVMPGRAIAPADHVVGPGELAPAEIQQRVDAGHDAFVQFAHNLQDAGLQALAAIDARNPQALMDAGGVIDEACEACHVTYWYPNQNRPGN